MSYLAAIKWKPNVNWGESVSEALEYFKTHTKLKFGDEGLIVVDYLCKYGAVTRKEIMENLEWNNDDVSTILSNVTMAIQKQKSVKTARTCGWYVRIRDPYTYIVCPQFAAAWPRGRQNKKMIINLNQLHG